MCGIIAYIGYRPALPLLLAGLKRLEYRGYDSAGVGLHAGAVREVTHAAGAAHAHRAWRGATRSARMPFNACAFSAASFPAPRRRAAWSW
jgi:glucosamine--fructose-6-phosphate aminotransferase (isomerizing)